MFRALTAFALTLGLSATLAASPGVAQAGIVNQPGRFRVDMPPGFRVIKHGRVPNSPSYVLLAQSARGNLKLYVRSSPHPDPTIDLGKHMNLWASSVQRRGLYRGLKPISAPHREHALITQFFTATGQRLQTLQPYTVYVGITLDRTTKRVYTFSVSSQSKFFHQNKARLVALARTFRPYHGEAVIARPGALRRGKRVSMRGRLVKQRSGLVTSSKR